MKLLAFLSLSVAALTIGACSQVDYAASNSKAQTTQMTCAERCATGKNHCSTIAKRQHGQCHHRASSSWKEGEPSIVTEIYQQYIDIPAAGTQRIAHCQKKYDADGKQKQCCEHHKKAQCQPEKDVKGHSCCTHGM